MRNTAMGNVPMDMELEHAMRRTGSAQSQRSLEYWDGYRYGVYAASGRITQAGRATCPHTAATAAADAWLFGYCDGQSDWHHGRLQLRVHDDKLHWYRSQLQAAINEQEAGGIAE